MGSRAWLSQRLPRGTRDESWLNVISSGPIVFVAQAGSHVEESVPAIQALAGLGVSAGLVIPTAPRGPLSAYRGRYLRWMETVSRLSDFGIRSPEESISSENLASKSDVLVVFNDWGATSELVDAFVRANKRVFGWVEGFQDFENLDDERPIFPYSRCDTVFTITRQDHPVGPPSRKVFVGSQRLWHLLQSDKADRPIEVLINLNFSYSSSPKEAQQWASLATQAAERAGLRPSYTRHPLDRPRRRYTYESQGPSGLTIPQSQCVISRRGTALLEGLAAQCKVIYFNPFKERSAEYLTSSGLGIQDCDNVEQLEYALIAGHCTSRQIEEFLFPNAGEPAKSMAEILVAKLR